MKLISEFNRLPDVFKETMILRYIDQYSYKRIAKKLKIPINTVRSRIYRSKKRLGFDIDEAIGKIKGK